MRGVVNTRWLYWLALAYLVVTFLLARAAVGSLAGRVWEAIRENEDRVELLGLKPFGFKLIAFVLGCALAGLGGAVYLLLVRGTNPGVASADFTLTLLVMVVLGRAGRLWGAALGGLLYGLASLRLSALAGSAVLDALPDWAASILSEPLFLLGSLFVLLMLFAPRGRRGRVDALAPYALRVPNPGIQEHAMTASHQIETARLTTHVLDTETEGAPVMFVHGNASDSAAWEEQLELLDTGYRGIAVDLRGYGRSEPKPLDVTRGTGDYADDLRALVETLELGGVHLVAHSLGAGVAYRYAIDHPSDVRSMTLVAPVSPYGFGGTRADGAPVFQDCAGSGGGAANPELVRRIAAGDRSDDDPASPRTVVRTIFFPTTEDVRDEDGIVESMLRTEIGDDYYPGTSQPSSNWPGMAPGDRGVLNAISPKYLDLSGFATSGCRAPVLWLRGEHDAVISDTSMLEFGHLGALGLIPEWPGAEVYPAQPMDAQTRQVLSAYADAGGSVAEELFEATGHFVFTQHPKRFAGLLRGHLKAAG